jgi:hypothetical protein
MTDQFAVPPDAPDTGAAVAARAPGVIAEYRQPDRYRRPFLARCLLMTVVTGLFSLTLTKHANPGSATVACLLGASALYNGVVYVWRGRFRTRITADGIELRGYFNHFVPWAEVATVQEEGYGDSEVLGIVYDSQPRLESPAQRVVVRRGRDRSRSTTGKRARLGVVRIVRRRGKTMMLRAPLVTAWAPDPYFDEKVRQMQQFSLRYGTPPIG